MMLREKIAELSSACTGLNGSEPVAVQRTDTYDGEGPFDVFHRECGGQVFAEVRCKHGHGARAANETDTQRNARFRR